VSESSRIDEVRAQYPHIQDLAYFNTGTYGSMADGVLQAYLAGTAEFERYGLPVYQQVLDRVETVRARIAERLRGQPSEISLTRNATDGVNLVVTGLDWQPGDEIIISDQEHPAMDQPWSWLAQTRGTVVRRFDVSPDPEIALANVRALITPRTRLIGSSWVTSALGIRLPARAIAALARAHGAYSLIDGAQVFAAIDVDVQELGCDFFTSNGHKWLCGPKGTGFLWTRSNVLQRLHPVHVGAGSFLRHARGDRGPLVPCPDGHRFEFASTTHSLWQGLGPAFDWFDHLGWDWIAARTAELAARVKDGLATVPGVEVKSPREPERSSGLTAFAVPGHDADELVDYLVREWHVQPRSLSMPGHVRVSTAYFNTEAEIDRLVDGVRAFLAA
jgi:selenocysteine lyase/cysteine desulfurase